MKRIENEEPMMNTDLETRVEESLRRSAERVVVNRSSEATWSRTRSLQRNRKRAKGLTSVCAALALLLTGVGVYQARDLRPKTVVQTEATSRLRLVPTWLPDGVSVRLYAPSISASTSQVSGTVWKKGGQVFILSTERNDQPERTGQYPKSTVDAAINDLEDGGYQSIVWGLPEQAFSFVALPPIPKVEFVALARSIMGGLPEVDPSMKIAPRGFPVIVEGDLSDLSNGPNSWSDSWNMGSWGTVGEPFVSLSANRPSELQRRVFDGVDDTPGLIGGRMITVRGNEARVSSFPSRAGSGSRFLAYRVNWMEGDWSISSFGSDEADLVRFVQGLKEATDDEWRALQFSPSSGRSTPDERRLAMTNVATVATDVGDLSVWAADLVSKEKCVSVVLKGLSVEEKFCLPITGKRVLWSGVRTLNSKKVVVAFVDLQVDAVRLTSDTGEPSTQIISSETIDYEIPAGFVVATGTGEETGGDEPYGWVGVVALPFEGDEPGRLEVFWNTDYDRNAPSEVPSETPAEGSETDTDDSLNIDADNSGDTEPGDYNMPLKALGRFKID